MARRETDQSFPLFKKEVLKMPEGHYSGDNPNPHLRKFVEDQLRAQVSRVKW